MDNNKVYKEERTNIINSLRTVSIFPGDLCGRQMFFNLLTFIGGVY